MDIKLYQQYLQEYVGRAIQNSNGTNASIAEHLDTIHIGRLAAHRLEKERALADARKAFDEHRHWPLDIVLSHLGVKVENKK